jgi:two-component system, cell cycle sensor histidine kinase and response regulator CckA
MNALPVVAVTESRTVVANVLGACGERLATDGGMGLVDVVRSSRSIGEQDVGKPEESAVRALREQYRALFEQSPFPAFLYDPETLRYLAVNDAATELYGYSREEFMTMSVEDVRLPPDVKTTGALRHKKKDGAIIDVNVTANKFVVDERSCTLAVAIDITEQKRMEEQLRKAKNVESIGVLAGGIAHDFNNLLSIILGYSEMVATALQPGDPILRDMLEISFAAKRAAEMAVRLVALSRQPILEPQQAVRL